MQSKIFDSQLTSRSTERKRLYITNPLIKGKTNDARLQAIKDFNEDKKANSTKELKPYVRNHYTKLSSDPQEKYNQLLKSELEDIAKRGYILGY